jgi:hypothetical protein
VDRIEGRRIKLTKRDSGKGSHKGYHHYIDIGLVAGIEGNKVRLSASGTNAVNREIDPNSTEQLVRADRLSACPRALQANNREEANKATAYAMSAEIIQTAGWCAAEGGRTAAWKWKAMAIAGTGSAGWTIC